MISSLQGTRLSPGQRRRLEQQRLLKPAFLNPVLSQQVDAVLAELEQRKKDSVVPEKIWTHDSESHGTVSVAEWMFS